MKCEDRALRILDDSEAPAWEILNGDQHFGAGGQGLLESAITIVDCALDHPVAVHGGGHHRAHLHAPRDAVAFQQELRV